MRIEVGSQQRHDQVSSRCEVAAGGFSEALAALLGRDAPGLSAVTIRRLKAMWQDEHAHWDSCSPAPLASPLVRGRDR